MSRNDFEKAKKPGTPPPYSIRFSWEQRAELDRLTVGRSWGSFIKEAIFIKKLRPPRRRGFALELDREILGKVLGALGKSRISSNLNQLAKAANSGSLPVNEEVHKAILEACAAIQWMKITLIEGMGLKAHRPESSKGERRDP